MLKSWSPTVLLEVAASTMVITIISSPTENPDEDETVIVFEFAALLPVTDVLTASVYIMPELTDIGPSEPFP